MNAIAPAPGLLADGVQLLELDGEAAATVTTTFTAARDALGAWR